MLRRLYIIALVAVTVMAALPLRAQDETYKFDIGGGLGLGAYMGDANESNPFHRPGLTVQAGMRYQIDARWALRGVFTTSHVSGDTSDFDNALPGGEQYEFASQTYDLGVRGEFNFFSYGIGETYKRLRRWSPYLSVGIGCTLASCSGATSVAVSLPMAFGIKYKIKPRLNLTAEFCMTKVLGDKVDGQNLKDLYQIKSSFIKNTDWLSGLVVSVTYEFGKRCETCHYVD